MQEGREQGRWRVCAPAYGCSRLSIVSEREAVPAVAVAHGGGGGTMSNIRWHGSPSPGREDKH